MNNIISYDHAVTLHVKNEIIDALSYRGGKWVGIHILTAASDRIMDYNVNIFTIINEMVSDGMLEKTFQMLPSTRGKTIRAPLYRLREKLINL